MKAISLTVLVLLSVASFAQAQNQSDISDSSVKNGKYLSFSKKITCTTIDKKSATRCLPKQQLAWQKQEIAKWKSAVRKATDMLPREFFERVGMVSWEFFVDRDDWATAYAGFPVHINLLSNFEDPPQWMTWEPLRKNGLTETERIFVAIHEMGHLSGESFNWAYAYQYQGIAWWNGDRLEAISSIHCENSNFLSDEIRSFSGRVYYRGTSFRVGNETDNETPCHAHDVFDKQYANKVPEENEVTLYGKAKGRNEDFAETFALYVMWPEYLKENFPLHYAAINKILNKEYQTCYSMPESVRTSMPKSVRTRLTFPFKTERCGQ